MFMAYSCLERVASAVIAEPPADSDVRSWIGRRQFYGYNQDGLRQGCTLDFRRRKSSLWGLVLAPFGNKLGMKYSVRIEKGNSGSASRTGKWNGMNVPESFCMMWLQTLIRSSRVMTSRQSCTSMMCCSARTISGVKPEVGAKFHGCGVSVVVSEISLTLWMRVAVRNLFFLNNGLFLWVSSTFRQITWVRLQLDVPCCFYFYGSIGEMGSAVNSAFSGATTFMPSSLQSSMLREWKQKMRLNCKTQGIFNLRIFALGKEANQFRRPPIQLKRIEWVRWKKEETRRAGCSSFCKTR